LDVFVPFLCKYFLEVVWMPICTTRPQNDQPKLSSLVNALSILWIEIQRADTAEHDELMD
jgi:hypothetical protein